MPDRILENVTINEPVADAAGRAAIATGNLDIGTIVLQVDESSIYKWDGSAWEKMTSPSDPQYAIVDGVGGTKNNFATFTDAFAAGKTRIIQTAATTEPGALTCPGTTSIYVYKGVEQTFTQPISLNSNGFTLQGDDKTAKWKYTPAGAGEFLTNGSSSNEVKLLDVSFENTTTTQANTSLCTTAPLNISGANIKAGDSSDAGISTTIAGSKIKNTTIEGSGSISKNALNVQNTILDSLVLKNDTDLGVSQFADIGAGCEIGSIESSGSANTAITISTSATSIRQTGVGTLQVTVEGTSVVLGQVHVDLIDTNTAGQDLKILGGYCRVFASGALPDSIFLSNLTGGDTLGSDWDIGAASNSVVNCVIPQGFTLFSGTTTTIVGCQSSKAPTLAGTYIRAGNNDLIGNDHDDLSSTFYDGIVDGVGTEPNTYADLPDAITAGAGVIKWMSPNSVASSSTLTKDTIIHLQAGFDLEFDAGVSINKGDFALRIEGVSDSGSEMIYDTTTALFTNGTTAHPYILNNLKVTNNSTTADTPICSTSPGLITNVVMTSGNADNAGIQLIGDGAYMENVSISAGGTSSTNFLNVDNGVVGNVRVGNDFVTSGANVTFSNSCTIGSVDVFGSNSCVIETSASITLVRGDNVAVVFLKIVANNVFIGKVSANQVEIDDGVSGANIRSGSISTLLLPSGTVANQIKISNLVISTATTLYGNNIFCVNTNFAGGLTTDASATGVLVGSSAGSAATLNGTFERSGNTSNIGNDYPVLSYGSGTHTTDWSGIWAGAQSGDVEYQAIDNRVTLKIPNVGAAITTATFVSMDTVLDSALRPATDEYVPILVDDDGIRQLGEAHIQTDGSIDIYALVGGIGFAGFGTGGLLKATISYNLN